MRSSWTFAWKVFWKHVIMSAFHSAVGQIWKDWHLYSIPSYNCTLQPSNLVNFFRLAFLFMLQLKSQIVKGFQSPYPEMHLWTSERLQYNHFMVNFMISIFYNFLNQIFKARCNLDPINVTYPATLTFIFHIFCHCCAAQSWWVRDFYWFR